MIYRGILRTSLLALLLVLTQATWSLAGTTGTIQGRVTDQNGNPIAGAHITVASPSETQRTVSAANGFYAVLDLSPDTYSVTASKDGYDTTTVYGITVTADQTTAANITLRQAIKTIGHITTTATASVVSKTVTGDLYAVNSQAISTYQGSQGGAETLYSQNGVVGSMPGVVRQVGSGGGYAGQGSLSMRGGSFDQIGFELEGIPLNRGFDFYNATSGLTNGLASLEVYTGGAPADAGRAMSGYVNEVIQRGRYPGGADFTGILGAPVFNHSAQADVYGGTPDNKFTYYVSTLALNSDYLFGNSSDLANMAIVVPANDPGCNAWNSHFVLGITGATIPSLTPGGGYLNCSKPNSLSQPQSLAAYSDLPYTAQRDTVANLHWTLTHHGLSDDLQALYVVGSTVSAPYGMYGTYNSDPNVSTFTSNTGYNGTSLLFPTGAFYRGAVGQPYNPALLTPLTWPTSGGAVNGPIPPTFQDSQNTQYSITKLSYTRSLNENSFLRLYEYNLYSFWSLDQPINGYVGFTFYQLHDNATGVTLNYQNQVSDTDLLKLDADYTRDLTLRYNYQPAFNFWGTKPQCAGAPCSAGQTVTYVGSPFAYWSSTTPVTYDGVLDDQFKPSDKWLFDLGLRWDQFRFVLMPDMQITGLNGLAYQAEEQNGQCLHGYNYSPTDPAIIGNGSQNCYDILNPASSGYTGVDPGGIPLNPALDAPGRGAWSDPPTSIAYNSLSPRFGLTYTLDPQDILRASVGRYVQPPDSAFVEYREAPFWGPGDTVQLLNRFYDGLGFYAVHYVKPEDSTNYDLSYEHDFSGGVSMKLTPYYRNTRGQILNLPVNPASPSFVTGYNFGTARIYGTEFLITKAVQAANGIGGTLAATFTNSKIKFGKGPNGSSYIDTVNSQISAYNTYYGTHYALLDPNAYYSPSYNQAVPASPSYDVRFVMTLQLDARVAGFDILPTFNYQSGNPYGDPQLLQDAHCAGPSGAPGNAPGCIPLPPVCNAGTATPISPCTAPLGGIGPDPYTNQFDAPGAFKGPSWWALNLGISRDIGHNLKASILGTNLLWGVHNQGYAWEQPASEGIVSYGDNPFYALSPLGLGALAAVPANPPNAYYGDDYYPYAGASAALAGGGALPLRTYIFSLSTKI
jgi:hypothetical protein